MKTHISIVTPRYSIENARGDFFDVFSKKKNAIKSAIGFAATYPGENFLVVRKSNHKSKIVFSIKIESQIQFSDLQDFYDGMISIYQKKKEKTRFWRKSTD
jgi:hypothetical protein